MANLTESLSYPEGIFRLETTTPVQGGAPTFDGTTPTGGWSNVQAKQLADRTNYLRSVAPLAPDNKPRILIAEEGGAVDLDNLPSNGWYRILITDLNYLTNAPTLPGLANDDSVLVFQMSGGIVNGLPAFGKIQWFQTLKSDPGGTWATRGQVFNTDGGVAFTWTPWDFIVPQSYVDAGDVDAVNTAVAQARVPAGAVTSFARNTAPTGWLKANGAAVSRITYATLFAAIGTTFGAGDGSTTFNLPDLRAEFVRGWDDGRGVDSGRAFGSNQQGSIIPVDPNGQTNAYVAQFQSVGFTPPNGATAAARVGVDLDTNGSTNYPNTAASFQAVTPTTNDFEYGIARPRNVALLYCIKF